MDHRLPEEVLNHLAAAVAELRIVSGKEFKIPEKDGRADLPDLQACFSQEGIPEWVLSYAITNDGKYKLKLRDASISNY
jgi:hypothetical protein